MTEIDNIQAVIATAKDTTPPQRVDAGRLYVVPTGDGGRKVIDLTGDDYLPAPRRKTGNVYVDDLNSFLTYFRKHSTPHPRSTSTSTSTTSPPSSTPTTRRPPTGASTASSSA